MNKTLIITGTQAKILKRKLTIGRIAAIGSYCLLLLFFTATFLLQPDGTLKTWLVSIVPLLIFLPGLIRQTHRTYSWICFVCLMYFVVITPLLMSRWLWSDWVLTLLIILLFISSMMTSRWLQYWRYYQSQQLPGNP